MLRICFQYQPELLFTMYVLTSNKLILLIYFRSTLLSQYIQ